MATAKQKTQQSLLQTIEKKVTQTVSKLPDWIWIVAIVFVGMIVIKKIK